MKRYILICLLMIGAACNVIAGPRRCTEQDIPMDVRPTYIQQARQMIEAYYTQLPLCIGEPMVKEAFIANFMQDGKSAYKPEFLPKAKYDAMLEPQQYLQELDKLALKLGEGELSFDIQKFSVNHKDFYAPSMVSCYLRANYQLVIKLNDSKLATRECEAYCLFPQAAVSINVKLMQVDVTKGEDYKVGQKSVVADREVIVSSTSTPLLSTSKDKGSDIQSGNKNTKENKVGFFYGLFHPDEGWDIFLYILVGLGVLWLIFEGFVGELNSPWVWLYTIGGVTGIYFLSYMFYYFDNHIAEDTKGILTGIACILLFGSGLIFGIKEKMWRNDYGKLDWSGIGTLLVFFSFIALGVWLLVYTL